VFVSAEVCRTLAPPWSCDLNHHCLAPRLMEMAMAASSCNFFFFFFFDLFAPLQR
jgi:hypothetical protein